MEDPEAVDEALELAIERTIAAQGTFETTPLTAPEVVPVAETVVRRAEDLTVLAKRPPSCRTRVVAKADPRTGFGGR